MNSLPSTTITQLKTDPQTVLRKTIRGPVIITENNKPQGIILSMKKYQKLLNPQLKQTLKPSKKKPSLPDFLTAINNLNLPKLTDEEIKSRYHTHLTKKYGQNLP